MLPLLMPLLCTHIQGQVNTPGQALVTAIQQNNITGVKQAIALQAPINDTMRLFRSPRTMAASANNHEVVALLLNAGADPNATFSTIDPNEKTTYLYIASAVENLCMVRLLLKAGANPNQPSTFFGPDDLKAQEVTPLHIAAAKKYEPIVRELLLRGATTSPYQTPSSLPPVAYALIERHLPLAAQRNQCILTLLEQTHNLPRDLTRLILLFADTPKSEMPSAPGSNHIVIVS